MTRLPALLAMLAFTGCSEGSRRPEMVEGPHAEEVLKLIQTNDSGTLPNAAITLEGVRFVKGEYNTRPVSRPAKPNDIPLSLGDVCSLQSVIGIRNSVRAHWECRASDLDVHREFLFSGGRLIEIRYIYVMLG